MMDLLLATSGGESQSASGGYVDDVFSAYTYTGNGSTQTINNGIDLAGKGGMVWTKSRTSVEYHHLIDTVRGGANALWSNDVSTGFVSANYITGFTTTGYNLGSSTGLNGSGNNTVSWTFRKAPKFFDVVTVNHVNGVQSNIDLSQLAQIGFVTVKRLDQTSNWLTWHRGLSAGNLMYLNSTNSQTADASLSVSGTTLSIAASVPSGQYVVYAWAHDPSADGIIQCGSFTTDSSGNATVNLGWEPQFLMMKRSDSSTAGAWVILDTMRGLNVSLSASGDLVANAATAENGTYGGAIAQLSATGFSFRGAGVGVGPAVAPFVYLAIRRPNKPPATGTQVYNAIARTGTGAAATVTGVGFAPDLVFSRYRTAVRAWGWWDRLRGATQTLDSANTAVETARSTTLTGFDVMDGYRAGTDANELVNSNTHPFINSAFKRAQGFFDVVCDTGTGAAHAIAHNLTKSPELIIRKSRSAATQWEVWHSALAATEKLVLNSDAAKATDATAWGSTLPTATQFTVGTGANVNANAATFVTYLFATLAGISKVGSYTGNGSSQTINCGFATGARFILIKLTDATGNWYVWDSVRGIIAANDPHLSLNTTAAEVTTDDSVDPDASGFIVNQNTATNINVNGGSYIFLAIA